MKKVNTVKDLKDVVGKRVRIVSEIEEAGVFVGTPEGILSNDKKFVDLEGDEIELDKDYVVIYDKRNMSGGTYCTVDERLFVEGSVYFEVLESN